MKNWGLHIFSDFDGTITLSDVCIDIIERFGEREPYLSFLSNGTLSLKEFWFRVLKTFPKSLTLDEINEFVYNNVHVDPFFLDFVDFCQKNNIPFEILSDGFEFYIQTTLKKLDINNIPFYGNQLIKEEGNFIPIFTYANESCNCENVGSCKRNIALTRLKDDEVLVYIGDGYSDFCMVEYSDIVFAKGILSKYCNNKRIPHYNYKTFSEIIQVLKKIIQNKTVKPRRQAQLNRKKAFEVE